MLPPAYEDNRVWVATRAEHQNVLQIEAGPAVLTPNGDEHNDVVGLGYQLVELTSPSWVAVAVWDLSGRRVHRVYEGLDGVGIYERVWDGRDASGRLVPPGPVPVPRLRRSRPSNGRGRKTITRCLLKGILYESNWRLYLPCE